MTQQSGRPLLLAILLFGGLGCGDDVAVIVEVQARPQVPSITSIDVTVQNDEDTETKTFDIGDRDLPLTFSITTSGRSGDLVINVNAHDADDLSRGVGTATVALDAGELEATVLLDPADFVVNTAIAGGQKPEFRAGRNGRQIAGAADGSFTVAFIDDCSQTDMICNLYARLFDSNATAIENDTTMDTGELIVNLDQSQGNGTAVGAVALGDTSRFLAWETFTDVRGAALSPTGLHETAVDTLLSQAALDAKEPDVAALAGDEYVIVWTQFKTGGGREIVGRLVNGDGAVIVNNVTGNDSAFAISTAAGADYLNPSVSATRNGREFVVTWEGDDNVFIKFFDDAGVALSAVDTPITALPADSTVSGPRAVTVAGGGAVVTWGAHAFDDPALERGAILIGLFAPPAGTQVGDVLTLTSPVFEVAPVEGAGPVQIPGPAIAVDSTGQIAAAWTECTYEDNGTPDDCDVFARLFSIQSDELTERSARIQINTTTANKQLDPSISDAGNTFVATWTDESRQLPDQELAAVRARVLFIPISD